MSNKQLICITGADGTGKSTLVRSLSDRLNRTHIASILDLQEQDSVNLFKSKTEIDEFLCQLTPDSRLLFLAHALKYSIEIALQSEADRILVNGYYYKYFATELALGADPNLVQDLSKRFPQPDEVIQLDLAPEKVVGRKQRFSRYECGLAQSPNKHDFVAFQKKVLPHWQNLQTPDWKILDATQPARAVLKECLKHLGDL